MEEAMNPTARNKRIATGILLVIGGMMMALPAALLWSALAGPGALVKERSGDFYRARAVLVAGPLIVCRRDAASHKTKRAALDSRMERTNLDAIGLHRIEYIEFIQPPVETAAGPAHQAPPDEYTGTYSINAAGNSGILALRRANGAFYGSIRFPNWGRGATEPLKGVRISGGKIFFVRSVTTPDEVKRTGANGPFVQEYSGEYTQGGRSIRGSYRVSGIQKQWDASKVR